MANVVIYLVVGCDIFRQILSEVIDSLSENRPDVERRGQSEDQAGKQDRRRGELKAAVLLVSAKRPAPYHIAVTGFQTLATEPCLHLSAHTAPHLLIQFSSVYFLVTVLTERQCLSVSRNHEFFPKGFSL